MQNMTTSKCSGCGSKIVGFEVERRCDNVDYINLEISKACQLFSLEGLKHILPHFKDIFQNNYVRFSLQMLHYLLKSLCQVLDN